ncbi:hypothetical protein QTG54_006573 [Skeletonema marinoi]|uniref:Uncharacterized protein n=1 Tax=Skeletonema marinoi TaxID=267567 RepID=A0AAD9DCW4_9STRA|nr:hypothetical protein QTG54_006573 [Skeletonema marinoi]
MDPPGSNTTHINNSFNSSSRRRNRCNKWENYLFVAVLLQSVALIVLFEKFQGNAEDKLKHPQELQSNIRNLENSHLLKDDTPHYRATSSSSFTVDILSVASINQLDLLHAQQSTIATHTSVRNFFNATEIDDADPDCHTDITMQHVESVSKFCRKRRNVVSPVLRYLRSQYANTRWLGKKKNPTGWLCAQVRPYSGLRKAQSHYLQTGQELPDYLLIFDDDTYYNMEKFQMNFASVDSSIEKVYSGCLVRSPIQTINFTFPFGGFGSILSKGALVRLFGKNQCPGLDGTNDSFNNNGSDYISIEEKESSSTEDSSSAFCGRLKENNVGELKYFTNGMSLVDLMYRYSSTERYRDVNKWTRNAGFCMHSDWVLGYFVNYYNVSTHVAEPYYKNVPHARLESYKGSEIYRRPTGFCRNDPTCEKDTEICHRATPEWMEMETKRWKLMAPDKFK